VSSASSCTTFAIGLHPGSLPPPVTWCRSSGLWGTSQPRPLSIPTRISGPPPRTEPERPRPG
jgi:hypothetical protein